jgi:SH3/ankyrin repeat-containing protein
MKVEVPDLKFQTRIVINKSELVLYAKQAVLEKLKHDWSIDVVNNYGLCIPSYDGRRLGKFLDETRLLGDYAIRDIAGLELCYKKRDYTSMGIPEKSLIKANSKANQKKLVEYINTGSVRKLDKLLDAGLDPNFIMDDGNTPLGLACGRNSHAACITSLLNGGAHIDFRGSAGLTPIHRAAIGGNSKAMKILLTSGSSPNYLDAKGLTPLYHASMIGDDITVCEALLKHQAQVGIIDSIGWSELHQVTFPY